MVIVSQQCQRQCKPVVDADTVVSVAKFKTHNDMVLTGAIKNFFGIVPTPLRHTYHSTSKLGEMMGEMLVDVFSVVQPKALVVCDAVVGMEGDGPLAGPPRAMGLIMASCDCVAHDAVMAALKHELGMRGLVPYSAEPDPTLVVRANHVDNRKGTGPLYATQITGLGCYEYVFPPIHARET